LEQPSDKPRQSSARQRLAVQQAYYLLRRHTCCDDRTFAISLDSRWHKTSQALFGKTGSLLPYLSDYRMLKNPRA
jgi:hypothetical protein